MVAVFEQEIRRHQVPFVGLKSRAIRVASAPTFRSTAETAAIRSLWRFVASSSYKRRVSSARAKSASIAANRFRLTGGIG